MVSKKVSFAIPEEIRQQNRIDEVERKRARTCHLKLKIFRHVDQQKRVRTSELESQAGAQEVDESGARTGTRETESRVLESHATKLKDSDEVLTNIAREKLERKATKSDDAQAPIYVCTKHYMEGSSIKWTKEQLEEEKLKVEAALETLRTKLLLWKWKRRLINEFNNWITDGPNESGVQWLKAGYEPGKITKTKSFYRYRWKEKGKLKYQEWHATRKNQRVKDYDASVDAIQRACRSTWWELL